MLGIRRLRDADGRPFRRGGRSLLALFVLAIVASASSPGHAKWTLDEALMPEGFSLSVKHRTRYEFLNDDFRTRSMADTDVIASRTLIHGRVFLPHGVTVGAELQDSRAEQNADTLLNTGTVNAVELLQAYLLFERPDLAGGTFSARGGRFTMDVGSRRFAARNNYRNTINGFTGLDLIWKGGDDTNGTQLRGFWTLPVQREPVSSRRSRLLDNDVVFDTESLDVQFWGLFAARDLTPDDRGELFVFGLHEHDASDRPTRNRQLVTPGFRVFRKPAKSAFDYTLETALQFGQSRTSASSTQELDHLAHFHHVTIGYSFDAPWRPRVALQYDFASGDRNPNDGKNERFDTLYGARRFDFNPTGIYGPFARSNLHTPGVRIQVKPHAKVTSFVAVRGFWLAAEEDTWTTSGVRDPAGNSGDYVGTQAEIRIRWNVLPGNLRLEAGYAHLFAGEFIDKAPNSPANGDSDYVYTQVSIGF